MFKKVAVIFWLNQFTYHFIQIVETEEEADAIFSSNHFDQYQQLYTNNPAKFVNQFPSENIICCKDLLLKVRIG